MTEPETMVRRWKALLVWLESHGMKVDVNNLRVECRASGNAGNGLFAVQACLPSTTMLTVPAGALFNIRTLAPHYCSAARGPLPLTATQLMSLHLYLHRPTGDEHALDDPFGPYLAVLPREFEAHPLTWLVKREILKNSGGSGVEGSLLDALPPRVMSALRSIVKRFNSDRVVVFKLLTDSLGWPTRKRRCRPDVPDQQEKIEDYLWAWLNVNTRCIYHRLKPSKADPDNLTLCPVVDFANHSRFLPHMSPNSSHLRQSNKFNQDLSFRSSDTCHTEAGEEMWLTYGAHSICTLFVEYGFADCSPSALEDGEMDVQDFMENFLAEVPGREVVKETLQNTGYWGDWTLHAGPGPARPSFRLITALRLCHIDANVDRFNDLGALENWHLTLEGLRDIVSDSNESAWRDTLEGFCRKILTRSEDRLHSLEGSAALQNETRPNWVGPMQISIRQLWIEEAHVARSVLRSLDANDQF